MRADYVIVGAGSAGCVLANRLSEDPAAKVVLIEAGGRDWSPYIHIPAGFMKMLDHPTLTWGYHAEPDQGTAGRAILYPRGRVLGGSSSINGLIYIRGQPEDFDHWAQLGNRGWGWDDVLPFFKKAENWEGGEDEVRGKGGPLFTSKMNRSPLCAAVIEAGKEIGLQYREDVNNLQAGAGDGIGWCQQTRGGRRRASTARTYLRPAMKRANLQVITKALVRRSGAARRCRLRDHPLRGCDRLAAYPATLGRRLAGASPAGWYSGAARTAGGRAEPAGPLHRPDELPGDGGVDGQRTLTGLAIGSRGPALSRHRQGHADLQRIAGRCVGQGARRIGDSRCAVQHCPRQLQRRPDRRARRF